MIGLDANTQTTDTICLPVSHAKKVLAGALQKKTLDTLITVYKSRIDLQSKKIDYLNEMVAEYQMKEENFIVIREDLTLQRNLWKKSSDQLSKQLKTARTTTRVAAVVGIVTTVLGIVIF